MIKKIKIETDCVRIIERERERERERVLKKKNLKVSELKLHHKSNYEVKPE